VKTSYLTWMAPSALLCLIGAALVWESTHTGGQLADAGILLGATLMALTLFPVSVAIDRHIRAKQLRRHFTHYQHSRPHGPVTRVTSPESTPPDSL